MTVSGGFAIVRSASVTAPGAMRECVEKPYKIRDFRRQRRRDDAPEDRSGPRDRRKRSSQNGTKDDVPFWSGPRLRAPFVAQVIAQVTDGEARPDTRSALASYAHVEGQGFFLDRSV